MEAPIVDTIAGRVRGEIVGGSDLERGSRSELPGVYAFRGIPYGRTTAGFGRFSPPRPPDSWTGVRDAIVYGDRAPQREDPLAGTWLGERSDERMSEDCLVLNVWTRGLSDAARRPVLVWFHGGGFSQLSGSSLLYDGVRLCQRGDVVVVTLNHRLNLFGFLYLAELAGDAYADSGNAGMLDLVQALEWVRDHAERFGGDPENVTVFGESGGGAKVSVLLGMARARGLFHRAIVQSGAHLHAQAPAAATSNAERLLAAAGIGAAQPAALRSLSQERWLQAYAEVAPTPWHRVHFSPVVDGRTLEREPWKPDAPSASAEIPLLISSTRTETTLLLGARTPELFSLDPAGLRSRLRGWLPSDRIAAVVEQFEKLHPTASPSEIFFLITSDLYARCPAWALAERKSAQRRGPVFLCELVYDTPVAGGRFGSPHTLDIPLVFDNVGRGPSFAPSSPEAERVSALMSEAWLAFARSGDPNHAALPAWPAYTAERPVTLLFDVEPRIEPDWRGGERIALAEVPLREIQR